MDQLLLIHFFLSLFSCVMIITSMNPIHSVFWMVLLFISLFIELIMMQLEFMSLILIVIYVGAMAMLFLFVIMMVDIFQLKTSKNMTHLSPVVLILGANVIFNSFFGYFYVKTIKQSIFVELNYIELLNMETLSLLMYSEKLLFMVMSMLLLVSMIGAMILTLEVNMMTKKQIIYNQHKSNNSWTM